MSAPPDPRVAATLRFAREILSWLKFEENGGCPVGWPTADTIARVTDDIDFALASLSAVGPEAVGPDPIRTAALNLVQKLDEVQASPAYQGVWGLYWAHGGHYTGPQYADELNELRFLLKPWRGVRGEAETEEAAAGAEVRSDG